MQTREGKKSKLTEDGEENETLKPSLDHSTAIILRLIYYCCPKNANNIQRFGFSAALTGFCCQLCHCINNISDLLHQKTPPSLLASSVLPRPLWLVSPMTSWHVHHVSPALPLLSRTADWKQTRAQDLNLPPFGLLNILCLFSTLSCTKLHILPSWSSLHPLNLKSTFTVLVSINKPTSHHRCPVAGADWQINSPNWKSMGPISSLSRADTWPTLGHGTVGC